MIASAALRSDSLSSSVRNTRDCRASESSFSAVVARARNASIRTFNV